MFDKVEKSAKRSALKLLGYRSYSTHELSKKLIDKGFSQDEASGAVEECVRLGLISDEAEGERRREGLKNRGYGPRRIAFKLESAGLKVPQMGREEEREAILKVLQKGSLQKKEREKKIAALLRRGFNFEAVLEAVGANG